MILFHVSPKRLKVLRPTKSQTAYYRIFLCDWDKLDWTMKHMADRHGVLIRKLYVYAVRYRMGSRPKLFRPGIFVTYQPIVPIARWRLP